MNLEHRKHIRQFADSIRSQLGLSVPVDVGQAVERLGGRIQRAPAQEAEAWVRALPADSDIRFEIGISPDVAEGRYRFSVAHEIAHLFLHMGFLTEKWQPSDEYVDSVMYRFGYSKEESEAHEFAGTLLMPEDDFRKKITELQTDGKVSLDRLAEHFGVSKDAARIRGCYLGIFDWRG
jgi:IrrE N-terminal-like domain